MSTEHGRRPAQQPAKPAFASQHASYNHNPAFSHGQSGGYGRQSPPEYSSYHYAQQQEPVPSQDRQSSSQQPNSNRLTEAISALRNYLGIQGEAAAAAAARKDKGERKSEFDGTPEKRQRTDSVGSMSYGFGQHPQKMQPIATADESPMEAYPPPNQPYGSAPGNPSQRWIPNGAGPAPNGAGGSGDASPGHLVNAGNAHGPLRRGAIANVPRYKTYGFILPDDSDDMLFFLHNEEPFVAPGVRVSFQVAPNPAKRGQFWAVNISPLSDQSEGAGGGVPGAPGGWRGAAAVGGDDDQEGGSLEGAVTYGRIQTVKAGYGFVQPEDGTPQLFFAFREGQDLQVGMRAVFRVCPNPKKPGSLWAANVTPTGEFVPEEPGQGDSLPPELQGLEPDPHEIALAGSLQNQPNLEGHVMQGTITSLPRGSKYGVIEPEDGSQPLVFARVLKGLHPQLHVQFVRQFNPKRNSFWAVNLSVLEQGPGQTRPVQTSGSNGPPPFRHPRESDHQQYAAPSDQQYMGRGQGMPMQHESRRPPQNNYAPPPKQHHSAGGSAQRDSGVVQRIDPLGKYGYITPDAGGSPIFFLTYGGNFTPGTPVTYTLAPNPKRPNQMWATQVRSEDDPLDQTQPIPTFASDTEPIHMFEDDDMYGFGAPHERFDNDPYNPHNADHGHLPDSRSHWKSMREQPVPGDQSYPYF